GGGDLLPDRPPREHDVQRQEPGATLQAAAGRQRLRRELPELLRCVRAGGLCPGRQHDDHRSAASDHHEHHGAVDHQLYRPGDDDLDEFQLHDLVEPTHDHHLDQQLDQHQRDGSHHLEHEHERDDDQLLDQHEQEHHLDQHLEQHLDQRRRDDHQYLDQHLDQHVDEHLVVDQHDARLQLLHGHPAADVHNRLAAGRNGRLRQHGRDDDRDREG